MVAHSDSPLQVPDLTPKFSGDLIEWSKFHNLRPDAAAAVSPPSKTPWSMVAIRNYHEEDHVNNNNNTPPIIFPPINHENLQFSPDPPPTPNHFPRIRTDNQQISFSNSDFDSDSDSISGSNSSSTFSPPSDSSPLPLFSPPRAAKPAAFDSWIQVLRSRVNVIVRLIFGSFTSSRGVFRTFRTAAFAAALIVFLYFRRRRRSRLGEGSSRDRLIGIIKERDEKINQLLDQISRMNQMLLSLHKVPTTPKS